MLPRDNRISPYIHFEPFISRYDHNFPFFDKRYEKGRETLATISGKYDRDWIGVLTPDKRAIKLRRVDLDDSTSTTFLADLNIPQDITRFDFSFDQLMNPNFAVETDTSSTIYYLDTVSATYKAVDLPGCRDLCLSLDDKRPRFIGQSDIILGYIREDMLCVRLQREKYSTEHVVIKNNDIYSRTLFKIGMSTGLRFNFDLRKRT